MVKNKTFSSNWLTESNFKNQVNQIVYALIYLSRCYFLSNKMFSINEWPSAWHFGKSKNRWLVVYLRKEHQVNHTTLSSLGSNANRIYPDDLCSSTWQKQSLWLVFADVPCISAIDARLGIINRMWLIFNTGKAVEGECKPPKQVRIFWLIFVLIN